MHALIAYWELLSGIGMGGREIPVVCMVCWRVRVLGRWVAGELLTVSKRALSHGYCPECAQRAVRQAVFGEMLWRKGRRAWAQVLRGRRLLGWLSHRGGQA